MPSSRFPHRFVRIPDHLAALARSYEGKVFVNLRPDQQPPAPPEDRIRSIMEAAIGAHMVYRPLRRYLHDEVKPGDKLLILFQGTWSRPSTKVVATCVVGVKGIYWTDSLEDCPRLTFDRPRGFRDAYGTNNFWGPYILALMKVPVEAEVFCTREVVNFEAVDIKRAMPCTTFIELARRYANV